MALLYPPIVDAELVFRGEAGELKSQVHVVMFAGTEDC